MDSLTLSMVNKDKSLTLLKELVQPIAVIGREVPAQILLPSAAVSSEHGVLEFCGAWWTYRDMESTNGSWHNAKKLSPRVPRILRRFDYLQLADVLLRIECAENEQNIRPTVLVFESGRYRGEYEIPHAGKALVVGGAEAHLHFRGEDATAPSLVIEQRLEGVCCYQVHRQAPLYRSGELISATTPLADQDFLQLGELGFLISLPPTRYEESQEQKVSLDFLKDWGDEEEGSKKTEVLDHTWTAVAANKSQKPAEELPPRYDSPTPVSGAAHSDETERTTRADSWSDDVVGKGDFSSKILEAREPEDIMGATTSVDLINMKTVVGADFPPSARDSFTDTSLTGLGRKSFEEKVIYAIGIFLLLILVLLVVWWVLA